MAGKKALGSWDVNDKRTKAGKEKQIQTNGVKMFDSTVSIASGLFKTGKKKNTKTKSNSYSSSTSNFEYEVLSEEEIQKRKEKDKKSLPYMIILGVISVILVIFFWLFIISLF
jgi:hypothetical protein